MRDTQVQLLPSRACFSPPPVYQVIRAWRGAARGCLSFALLSIKIGFAINLHSSSFTSPPSFPPHFNSPWLLPTPIKHYNHKNPQALKSCPGGVGWGGVGRGLRGWGWGKGGVHRQKHPPLYTPQSLRPRNERKMEGRMYCL